MSDALENQPMSSSRRPLLAAAIVTMVMALLVAGAFVAGLSVGGGRPAAGAPSSSGASQQELPRIESVSCTQPSEAFAVLCETYARIKANYVDQVTDEELVRGAVKGMVDALPDPYSGYLTPDQYRASRDDLSGEFTGIGAEVGVKNLADPANQASCTVISTQCALVIIAPLDGSPAEAAGLQPGDIVLTIDGGPTAGSTVQDEVFKVRGPAGTNVTLHVQRGDRELDVIVTRQTIRIQVVESRMLDAGTGYIRLSLFTADAANRFREGLASLQADGADALVVDLRDNPGGFITAAQGVASQLVGDGLLFTVESGGKVERYEAEGGGLAIDQSIRVVVLVNQGSASASEIVVAALKERGRATIVGQPTFGKNTVQIWTDLPDGGGLRLTTDRWFTPNHNTVEGGGLAPDVVVSVPDPLPEGSDPVLDRAVALLHG
jgi:carboxyl-terminal processing protease